MAFGIVAELQQRPGHAPSVTPDGAVPFPTNPPIGTLTCTRRQAPGASEEAADEQPG